MRQVARAQDRVRATRLVRADVATGGVEAPADHRVPLGGMLHRHAREQRDGELLQDVDESPFLSFAHDQFTCLSGVVFVVEFVAVRP